MPNGNKKCFTFRLRLFQSPAKGGDFESTETTKQKFMQLEIVQQKIFDLREQKVMLDFDLAILYGVETRVLNQAVKRNIERFPEDFMFQLTAIEWNNLKSQIVISSWGGTRKRPLAFTEHGVTMLASVLKSKQAVKTNITIVRAFIAMRQLALHYKVLAEKIIALEKNYDKKFDNVYEALKILLKENEVQGDWKKRKRIGFVK